MAFNISNLKTNIADYGYLKNDLFEVIVTNPPILLNRSINSRNRNSSSKLPVSNEEIKNYMKFRIEQVRAPGISLLSSDVVRYGVGPIQKMPHNATYPEITISILSDGYGQIWQYWHNWLRSIFEFSGVQNGISPGSTNAEAQFNTSYKDDYATTMQIVIYGKGGDKDVIKKINLLEAFPTSMRDVQLSWEGGDLIRLAISISFSTYVIEGASLIDNIRGPR